MPDKSTSRSFTNSHHLVEVSEIGLFFSVFDADDRAWLAKILETAMRTRTGRQVLRRAAVARQGRPIPVQVENLRADAGRFNYDWELLQLDRGLKHGHVGEAVATLVHEVLHLIQFDIGLPSDALEMELEAYVVTLQVLRELGLKIGRQTFSYGFEQALLRGGAPEVVSWLQFKTGYDNYDISILNGDTIAEFIKELERRRRQTLRSIVATKKLLAKRRTVMAALRAARVLAKSVANYKTDQITPLRGRLRAQGNVLTWQEHDLAILKDPVGVSRYRAFAKRVYKRMERFHRTIAG